MRIEISGVDMTITDEVQNQVHKKLDKFNRYFGDDTLVQVKMQPEHNDLRVELTLNIRKDIYRSEAVGQAVQAALQGAIDNMERKIRKHKTKLKRRKQSHNSMFDYLEALPEVEEQVKEEPRPQITRRKTFVIDAMLPEEAALQMELIDHDFFLYLHPETGKVNLLYKRKDGDYGILEPEY